jgi:hypothetical protein
MSRVALIHWKPEEAVPLLTQLRDAGFEADATAPNGSPGLARLREPPPSALVIDLSRLPSHGKAVAEQWRLWKSTRGIPIVFVGGAPDKVASTRALFPDAAYAHPSGLAEAVRAAIRTAPDDPVVRRSMSGYSGTPLAKKLGIKTDVVLLNAPQGFVRKLEPLPDGVRIHTRRAQAHRVLLFTTSAADLHRRFEGAADCVTDGGGLWIVYPKQTSGVASDLTQAEVRGFAMNSGWVDYKVCAVDETWTGLLFARRRAN